jgi:hypothetical protein
VLANPDVKLRSVKRTPDLTPEQRERMVVTFDILISLFERAHTLLYGPGLTGRPLRRWQT